MTSPVASAPAEPTTPADQIRRVRAARAHREQAEREVLALALDWATSHEVEGPVREDRVGSAAGFGDGLAEFLDVEPTEPTPVPDSLLYAWERAAQAAASGTGPASASCPPAPTFVASEQSHVDDVEESRERRRWRGLPELQWDCAAPFASALGLTTRSGWNLLRQAVTVPQRLPRIHARWEGGAVETRVAKLVADAVAGQPDDVCGWVDAEVSRRIDKHRAVGPVIIDRLVAEALTELHAEEVELEREARLLARFAKVLPGPDGRPGPDAQGLAEFLVRGEWPDIKAFDDTLAALAEALRRGDGPEAGESLEVRRSIAVGILADPIRAAALLGLAGPANPADASDATGPSRAPAPRRRQQILAHVHLSAEAVAGSSGAASLRSSAAVGTGPDGAVWLEAAIRDWMARPDVDLAVRPVVHCGGCPDCDADCREQHATRAYEPTDLDKERVAIRTPRCVFPFCTMPARRTDCDHIVAFDPDDPAAGPTCARCNLAPLCRHHHRLKTLAGWCYRQVEPGVFGWTEPHGQAFLTTRWGTRDITDEHSPPDPPPTARSSSG